MEQFYNQTVTTEQQARPQLRRVDWVVISLAVVIMALVTWHKTRTEPVVVRPESAEVLRYFCETQP